MPEFFEIIGLLLAIGVGMGCGSYATMPYYRLPNGIPCAGKWVGEKSACPSCGAQLRTRDLVPVLNWLWTRGKCYNCQTGVNPVYFFIEFSCTILSVLLYGKFGFDQMYIITLGLAVCLVIITATQYTYQVVPDAVLIVIVMLGFLYRPILDGHIYDMVYSFTLATLGALIYVQFYKWKTGKEIKNFGLLKLVAVSGIWLSAPQVILFGLMIFIFSGLTSLAAYLFGRSTVMLLGGLFGLLFLINVYIPELPSFVWYVIECAPTNFSGC